jgi:hypothetical protein
MKQFILISFLFTSIQSVAQVQSTFNIGKQSAIQTTPLLVSTSANDVNVPLLNYTFINIPNQEEEKWGALEEIKKINAAKKYKQIITQNPEKKTRGAMPTIGTGFRTNELETMVPTDNSMAISKDGKIITCSNFTIEYYDQNGTILTPKKTYADFVNNDPDLSSVKFDPRVIYDANHDRFIVVVLHGTSSVTTKVLIAFSKTNNPVDGFNIYALPGNPLQDTSWTDFPTIGVSNDDLFINANLFKDASLNYAWNQTYIYQIDLSKGYAGTSLQHQMWNQISAPDGYPGVTCFPAQAGNGNYLDNKMYFVQTAPDSGSHVYVFEINGQMTSSNKQLNAYMYPIPHFETCADAYEKELNTGYKDSLSTGAAWVNNAMYTKNTLHFTYAADVNGWCGIKYGRVDLINQNATVVTHSTLGQDYAYPAVATLGSDSLDKSVAIAYLRADTTFFPGIEIIGVNDANVISTKQIVKTGDTIISILSPPSYPAYTERWGDYTGICARYNAPKPEVWLAGTFGANNPVRKASYATYIAQIISGENNVNVSNTHKEIKPVSLFPNPTVDMFFLQFENTESAWTKVTLVNAIGEQIKVLHNDNLKAGNNILKFNKLALAKGVYFVNILANNKLYKTEKLVVQ